MQFLFDRSEYHRIDDRIVFAFVDFVAIRDLAEIDPVGEQIVQRVLGERPAANGLASFGDP